MFSLIKSLVSSVSQGGQVSGSSLGHGGLVNGDNSSVGVSHETIVGGGSSRDGGDSGIGGGGSGIGGVNSGGGHGVSGIGGVNPGGVDRCASSVVVISPGGGNSGLVN